MHKILGKLKLILNLLKTAKTYKIKICIIYLSLNSLVFIWDKKTAFLLFHRLLRILK